MFLVPTEETIERARRYLLRSERNPDAEEFARVILTLANQPIPEPDTCELTWTYPIVDALGRSAPPLQGYPK